MKYGYYIIIFLLLTVFNSYSQTNNTLQNDEIKLFYLINNMRKDRNLRPFKFSEKLYKNIVSRKTGVIIRTDFGSGVNYIEELASKIKSNFALYRKIIDPDNIEAALKIVPEPEKGKYYSMFLEVQGPQKNPNSYYYEVKEFEKILKVFDQMLYGYSRQTVLQMLDDFIHDPTEKYDFTISTTSVTMALKDRHKPFSYIQLIFSNSIDIFTGIHTKTYFFKEKEHLDEIKKIKKDFKSLDEKYKDLAGQYKKYSRITSALQDHEKNKISFWISDNEKEIAEFRWMGDEGVYITRTQSLFGVRYINYHKEDYGIKYPIPQKIYLRLLVEYLRRSLHFEVTEFIKQCKISYYQTGLVKRAEMNWQGDRIIFQYFYDKNGKMVREEFYLNNQYMMTWNY